jgi:hypothetical protein
MRAAVLCRNFSSRAASLARYNKRDTHGRRIQQRRAKHVDVEADRLRVSGERLNDFEFQA